MSCLDRLAPHRAGVLLLLLVPASPFWFACEARAQLICEMTQGPPGQELTLRIEIDSPAQGEIIQGGHACEIPVTIRGRYFVDGPIPARDYYIAIDRSGSTAADNIYQDELTAVERFLDAVDGTGSAVGLVSFATDARQEHRITQDLASVRARIVEMRDERPSGGTVFSVALQMIRDMATMRPVPPMRPHRALFLSDGDPDPSDITAIRALLPQFILLDLPVHTFDLQAPASGILQEISATTGGIFTMLASPGDIVDVLPEFATEIEFVGWNETTSTDGIVNTDPTLWTFMAEVVLVPGDNVVILELSVPGPNPVILECRLDLTLVLPWPEDVGKALRVVDLHDGSLMLDWRDAAPRFADQHYQAYGSLDSRGPFAPHPDPVFDQTLTIPMPAGRLNSFDLRTGNCAADVSYDPYPAVTDGLLFCWVPPRLTLGYPLASNLTDPGCASLYPDHACDPGLPLPGVDREFLVELASAGTLVVTLDRPALHAVVYGPAAGCLAQGEGGVIADIPAPGTYSVVVDSPAGGEDIFNIRVDLE